MIYNYYNVDKLGRIIERYRLEESDKLISLKSLKKEWEDNMISPVFNHRLNTWDEGSKIADKLFTDRNKVKNEFSNKCKQNILSGFKHLINGTEYHFSYDYESQTNLQETYHLFQNNVIESVKWSVRLDEESVRIDLNKKDFEAVFFASVRHKQAHISKFKDQIEPLIDAQSTIEGLEAITWDGVVTNPPDPGVVFKTDDTLDKQVDTLDVITQTLNEKTELSDMAIMEIAMMVSMMMGGPM